MQILSTFFSSTVAVLRTAVIPVPHEELTTSVVSEYPRAKRLGEKASRKEEVQSGKEAKTHSPGSAAGILVLT